SYQTVMLMDSKANASKTYDDFDTYIEKLFQSFAKVPLTTVSVPVGDRGKMYVIHNVDQSSLIYYMIFVRSNVFEVVGLEVPVTSTQGDDIVMDLAGKADRKITTQLLPVISQVPCPAVVVTPLKTPFNTLGTPTPIPVRTVDVTQVPTSPATVVRKGIEIKNFAFDPPALTVTRGTVVEWTNLDGTPHAIVFDIGSPIGYSSGSLPTGSMYSLRFTLPGTYMYHCSIHPSMKGTIIVQT
ncbi:MAG TPA: plastocyanin/azurin family copper-binding protein, partial [Methanoregula sp.]|nr:plastocyanin/azurin family copper-binding protein [Methanoregula sp.]